MLELHPMDYHEVNFKFDEKYEPSMGVEITDEQKRRVRKLRLDIKNAIMHHIL